MPAVTGRYITSDDLINSFGTTNISVWSNLDGQGATLNTVAVTAAISRTAFPSWWLLPTAILALLPWSVWRTARRRA